MGPAYLDLELLDLLEAVLIQGLPRLGRLVAHCSLLPHRLGPIRERNRDV